MIICIHRRKILEFSRGRTQAWHKRKNESAIKQHAETTGHDIHANYVELLERGVSNQQKSLFLESWHSTLNTNAVNERHSLPKAYLPFIELLRDQSMPYKSSFNYSSLSFYSDDSKQCC